MLRLSRVWRDRPYEVTRIASNLPHFDICIIGAGPAGIAAAQRAVHYNKRVCLIESHRIGGCDVWNGTLQSKTLWEMSKYVSRLTGPAARRVFDESVLLDLPRHVNDARLQQTLREVSETREAQLRASLVSFGVTIVFGHAMFSSPFELDVHRRGGGEYQVVTADYFIIATGSKPREHPHFPCDAVNIVTTDAMLTLPIPSSLVIVGAGVAGCELASVYAHLGRTRVALIDKAPRVLPMEDEDIARFVQQRLARRGVRVHHACELFDLEARAAGGCVYAVRGRSKSAHGAVECVAADRALIALGRAPSVERLGLDRARCAVADGRLVLDAFGRCRPHAHIYAAGDAAGGRCAVNVAEETARAAVDRVYSDKRVRPATDPSTLMCLDEEVAGVGRNEQQCRAARLSYMVARVDYAFQCRAMAMGETAGFCKVLVTNDREKRVLGVRAVGAHAGSIVEVAALSVRREESAYELLKLVAAYPSVVQSLVECIRLLVGRASVKADGTNGATLRVWHPPNLELGRAYAEREGRTLTEDTREGEGTEMAMVWQKAVAEELRQRGGETEEDENKEEDE